MKSELLPEPVGPHTIVSPPIAKLTETLSSNIGFASSTTTSSDAGTSCAVSESSTLSATTATGKSEFELIGLVGTAVAVVAAEGDLVVRS